jgi:hypothetical protein
MGAVMSTRKWNVAAFAIGAVLAAIAPYSPAVAQVEYVKICETFGTGFYYIPGTDICLKIAGRIRDLPSSVDVPAPPAGCSNCDELDKAIVRETARFNKLEGKGVPKWQEDIASDIANLRAAKAECAKVCAPPPARTTQSGDGGGSACSSYGNGFYYIPGEKKYCLQVTTLDYILARLQEKQALKPAAGCSSCAALDVELAGLRAERAEWVAKKNATFVLDVDTQIRKLVGLKSACQNTCQRTAEKQKPQPPPQRSQTPPQKFGPPIDRGTLH